MPGPTHVVWQIDVSERESPSTAAEEPRNGFVEAFSLLRRNRDFRNLFVASLISLGGDWFLFVAIAGLIQDATGQILGVSLLLFWQEIPYFLMSPLGGALADRLDRRKLMVGCDLARAGLCLAFLFIGMSTYWIAFPLLAVLSSFSAAFEPAFAAAVPNLVEPRDLGPANALSGSSWGTMLAVGAALGGVVTATLGRDAAFLVDAASFVISAGLIFSIRGRLAEERDHREHPKIVQATKETAVYARKDHRVLALLTVKGGFGLGAGVLVLVTVFPKEVFHWNDYELGIGILMAARGVGALIGPFLGRWLVGREDRRLFAIIGAALATFGIAYAVFGLTPNLLLAAVAVGVAHLGGGAQWTLSSYGLQRIVPDHIRGRIFAFDGALITLTLGLSAVLTGLAADRFGPRNTAVALGAIALVWAVVWAWLTADVRRATMLEGCGPTPEIEPEPAG